MGGPAGNIVRATTLLGADGDDLAVKAGQGADGQHGPGQGPGAASGAPVGEEHEDADEVETVNGQRERVGVDAQFPGAFGEQEHVLVGDPGGEAGQSGDGDTRRLLGWRCRPGSCGAW